MKLRDHFRAAWKAHAREINARISEGEMPMAVIGMVAAPIVVVLLVWRSVSREADDETP